MLTSFFFILISIFENPNRFIFPDLKSYPVPAGLFSLTQFRMGDKAYILKQKAIDQIRYLTGSFFSELRCILGRKTCVGMGV